MDDSPGPVEVLSFRADQLRRRLQNIQQLLDRADLYHNCGTIGSDAATAACHELADLIAEASE